MRLLSWPLNINCCFPSGRFLVGAGGFWTWVVEGRQPSQCARPQLWGYSPGYGATAPLVLWQPANSPKTTPKTPRGLGQHSSGAAVGHPITPGRWERVPFIPCSPTRWDEGTDVLSLAGTRC